MKCQHMTCHQCDDTEVTILRAEVAALRARAEEAEAEAEVLLWNLAGCEVYALGNSLDQEPAPERTRPALLAVLGLAQRYRDRRKDHEDACELVARMHAAAVGEVCGPIKGVVEDIAALKTERDAALVDNARMREALRGMVDAGERAMLTWRCEPFTLRRLEADRALSTPAPVDAVVLTREEAERIIDALVGETIPMWAIALLRGKGKP